MYVFAPEHRSWTIRPFQSGTGGVRVEIATENGYTEERVTVSFSRRYFLQAAAGIASIARARLRSFARVGSSAAVTSVPESKEAGRLFPANLPTAQWQVFQAAGYSNPVTGIIYRNTPSSGFGLEERPRPDSGVLLGTIDTGGLGLEGYETFGYSCIFNNYVPPGGPLNTPFLGIRIGGQTRVLTTGRT
jgi:hypothetical protein